MATTTVTLDGSVVSGSVVGSLALVAGSHTVVVAGQDLAGNAAVPQTRTFFGANPGIAINKVTMDGTRVGDDASMTIVVGMPIVWQYTVTNTGNVALASVQVTDNQAGVTPAYVSGDTNGDGKLDTSETWIFKASGTAVLGAQSNIGTARASFTDSAGQTAAPAASDASGYTGIVYTPPPSSSLAGIVFVDYNNDGQFQGGCYQWGSGCFDKNWNGCGQSNGGCGSGWWSGGSNDNQFFGWNSCPWSSNWTVGKTSSRPSPTPAAGRGRSMTSAVRNRPAFSGPCGTTPTTPTAPAATGSAISGQSAISMATRFACRKPVWRA